MTHHRHGNIHVQLKFSFRTYSRCSDRKEARRKRRRVLVQTRAIRKDFYFSLIQMPPDLQRCINIFYFFLRMLPVDESMKRLESVCLKSLEAISTVTCGRTMGDLSTPSPVTSFLTHKSLHTLKQLSFY